MRASALITLAVVLLWGCATRIPSEIDAEIAKPQPSVAAVRANPEQYHGQTVRWGGTIVDQENRAEVTLLEVVGRELESGARPRGGDTSHGRFLAVVEGFLDPAIYEQGRLLTVVGELDGIEVRKIGDYDYAYPRVLVTGHRLWEPRPDRTADFYDPRFRPSPWYHPYRDPWFPHHRRSLLW